MNRLARPLAAALAAAALVAWPAPAEAQDDGAAPDAYPSHAQLMARIDAIARTYPDACVRRTIGTSRGGRAIGALELAAPGDRPARKRAALLIVASIDGDHLVGSAVALEVAERLLARSADGDEDAAALLSEHTVYVVPRVNPDASELYFADLREQRRRNLRPDDADRDRQTDEDGPDDLDGDGIISMMRVYDAEKATHLPDPDAPRIDKRADRDAGERPLYYLATEGRDDDGDGAVNEDGPGGVDLDRNFMHGYEEHADGTGPHQVSEPESLAMLRYALDRQNIAVVLTYGVHDNLSASPATKGRNPAGGPKTIEASDVALYKTIGERFREITGLKEMPNDPADGAFFAWAYAQFGVPSFTTPLWTRPEPTAAKAEDGDGAEDGDEADTDDEGEGDVADNGEADGEDEADGTPSPVGDISQETLDELRAAAEAAGVEVTDEMAATITPEEVVEYAGMMGVKVRRAKKKDGNGKDEKKKKKKKASGEAAWLDYSDDERDGAGFIEWKEYDHPDLGRVEIGGFAPYFRLNPPYADVDAIAEKQVEFVLDLGGRMPDVALTTPEVKRLGAGLFEVKAALVNDGALPTGTAMAVRNRRARPHVVRLDVPVEQVITGQRVSRAWTIPGHGGRIDYRWVIEAADGSPLTITVYSEKYGGSETTIRLVETDEDSNGEGGGR